MASNRNFTLNRNKVERKMNLKIKEEGWRPQKVFLTSITAVNSVITSGIFWRAAHMSSLNFWVLSLRRAAGMTSFNLKCKQNVWLAESLPSKFAAKCARLWGVARPAISGITWISDVIAVRRDEIFETAIKRFSSAAREMKKDFTDGAIRVLDLSDREKYEWSLERKYKSMHRIKTCKRKLMPHPTCWWGDRSQEPRTSQRKPANCEPWSSPNSSPTARPESCRRRRRMRRRCGIRKMRNQNKRHGRENRRAAERRGGQEEKWRGRSEESKQWGNLSITSSRGRLRWVLATSAKAPRSAGGWTADPKRRDSSPSRWAAQGWRTSWRTARPMRTKTRVRRRWSSGAVKKISSWFSTCASLPISQLSTADSRSSAAGSPVENGGSCFPVVRQEAYTEPCPTPSEQRCFGRIAAGSWKGTASRRAAGISQLPWFLAQRWVAMWCSLEPQVGWRGSQALLWPKLSQRSGWGCG